MDPSPKQDKDERRSSAGEPSPSFLEWVVAAAGMLLLVGSLGYLLHQAWFAADTPPAPHIEIGSVEELDGHFLVRLRVFNRGKATAAALRIEGELKRGDEVVERSEVELQYLPGGSRREAGMFFSQDPRTAKLDVFARSYRSP